MKHRNPATRESAMLIRCPTCLSAYDLPSELLNGRDLTLRCARCRNTWTNAEDAGASGPFASPGQRHDGPEIVAEARSSRRPLASQAPAARRPAAASASARRPISTRVAGAAVIAITIGAMAATARKDLVVRLYPPSAGLFEAIGLPVNLRGLALADMHGTLSAPGSRPVLTLQGRISNLRRESISVPPLRIAVRDKAHNELYSWTASAPKSRLGAGETIVFRSRLAAPPEDGQDLMVSFADSADPRVHSESR